MAKILGFAIGDRVEIHPGTDAWMMGDRFGVVEKIGRRLIHIKMDRSGRVLRFLPETVNRV